VHSGGIPFEEAEVLTFDRNTQTIRARDAAGRLLWQAEIIAEDAQGPRRYRGGRAGPWRIALDLSSADGFEVVGLAVRARPDEVLRRLFLRLSGGRNAVPPLAGSRTRMLALSEDPFGDKGMLPLGEGRAVSSSFFTVLHQPNGPSLLAGVAELGEDYSLFRVAGGMLEAGFEVGRPLRTDTRYALAFAGSDDPLDLMAAYGRYLKRFARPRAEPVTGWNSWDYYGASITMDDLRQEMAAINASPLKGTLTHFVVDMGWWTDWGDVQLNRRFPATFRGLAREISGAGFVPGIWHAPLQVSPWTHLGRHRQDLLVPAEGGGPVLVGGNALLDWSKPEALQLLYDQFRKLRRSGFRYFKLDYIYHDAVRAMTHRADQSVGPLAVIRRGLHVIREAVGDDAYILSCGAPRECAVGLADASRVCTDTHTFWSHIWNNAREIACHLWENGHLWNIDPDFAIVRSPETTDDPFPNYPYRRRPWTDRNDFWMAGPEASSAELRVWLTVVHMSGGDVFLSDSIARLNAQGLGALEKLFPRLPEAARPLDLFLNSPPRFWLAGSEGAARLAVFNWEDEPAPITVPAGLDLPSDGADIWTGQRVSVSESTTMPPHSAHLLRI
jgi:hypothetical protein